MEITNNRLKHSLSVAKKMKVLVEKNPDLYRITPDEAFVLGMLHDIGYEFSDTPEQHAAKGGRLLSEQGYRFWEEIYFHGIPQEKYSSAELWLLNYSRSAESPLL